MAATSGVFKSGERIVVCLAAAFGPVWAQENDDEDCYGKVVNKVRPVTDAYGKTVSGAFWYCCWDPQS